MELLSPEPSLIIWTILSLAHIFLAWIGTRKMIKLHMDPFIKFIWLLAILFIPFAGIATFFALQNNKSQVS